MAVGLSAVSFVLLLLLLTAATNNSKVHDDHEGFAFLPLETLTPSTVCITSKAPSSNSLKVVYRHGPCFPSAAGQVNHIQILAQDARRVAYLQNRVRLANVATGNKSGDAVQESLVTLPVLEDIGTGNYVVTVGIGTPKRDQTVVLDTGSNVCWVQCRPCVGCPPQRDPMFDPHTTSTYHNVTCSDPACTGLSRHGCVNNTCTYQVTYADSSGTAGFLAVEKLTLSPATVIQNFVFGCGQRQHGIGGVAGLFGLGRNPYSLVSQASSRLGNTFSYCLPTNHSHTGYLTIGRSTAPSPSYTAMMTNSRGASLYFIDLIGITVGVTRLIIPPATFQRTGTLIDSGTVVTHLPPMAYTRAVNRPALAYTQLRDAFRRAMSQYTRAPPYRKMDTCYDFRAGPSPWIPVITLHFNGVNLQIGRTGSLYTVHSSRVCLAFIANEGVNEVSIFGNYQQRGMEVIYDLGGQRIGFAPNHCD